MAKSKHFYTELTTFGSIADMVQSTEIYEMVKLFSIRKKTLKTDRKYTKEHHPQLQTQNMHVY